MAQFFECRVYGIAEWNFRAALLERSTRERVQNILDKYGRIIQGQAKQNITDIPWVTGPHGLYRSKGREYYEPDTLIIGHVDWGDLRQSISVNSYVSFLGEMVVNIGSDVEYAPFVEAHPYGGYLIPAAEEHEEHVVDEISAALQKLIDSIAKAEV